MDAYSAAHTGRVRFVLGTQSNHAVLLTLHAQFVLQIIHANIVQDILLVLYAVHIINVNIVMDTLTVPAQPADVPHIILIIVIVQTTIK